MRNHNVPWARAIGTGLVAATALSGALACPAAAQESPRAEPSADGAPILLGAVKVEGGDAPLAPGANPYADRAAPYKADRLSSSRFTQPVLNTARSETVITKEALDDKEATTLREVARSTAGVTLGSGEGGNAFGDRFFIRGFDARNDVFIDGVRDPGVSIRENFNVEQVEILRGPASSFAGRGTTGGALNIVTKAAQDADFTRVEGNFGIADSSRRGTIDINRRVSSTLDVRLNGMVQYGDVAGRDFATDNRWGLAAAVTYTPSDSVTFKANLSHTHLWGLPDFGVPYDQVKRAPATEGDVPRNTYYGIVNRDFTRSTQDVGTLDTAWRVNDAVTLESKFRASHALLDYIGTIPENPSAVSLATRPFSSTPTFFSGFVQLNAQSRYEPVTVIADQLQATFKFRTGAVDNIAVVGGELSSEKIAINSYTGFTSELTTGPVAFTSSGAPIVSVYAPPHYLYGAGVAQLGADPLRYRVATNAGFLIDTANYHDRLILNAGLRYDNYAITAATTASARRAQSDIFSYNLGLVFKPAPNASLYLAYATAADPVGDELDATASAYGGLAATQNAAQIFGPQRSQSIELGAKWELFDRHLLASVAAFQNRVTNARETAPNGLPGYASGQIVAGAAYRVRGLDFEVAGNITPRWSVLGGLVIMDPRIERSLVPSNVGLQLANIAPTSFNLLTKYQLTPWLELGSQGVYASQIKGGGLLAANGNVPYPGAPNPTLLPAHWRFDAFAEVAVNSHIEMKLYGQNLFDKTYYDSLYQSAQPFIAVAPGRNVFMEVTIKF